MIFGADPSPLLSAPVQYGALGLCAILISGGIVVVREIIKAKDTLIASLIATAEKKDERVLTVLQDAAVAATKAADATTKAMEYAAVQKARERDVGRTGGR